MVAQRIQGVTIDWDAGAALRREPGIYNSYMGALAGVLRYLGRPVDPAWLMGVTGWAFRIHVHETLCPSATSVYDWSTVLPETVAQVGYDAMHVHGFFSPEQQNKAHEAIVKGLAAGMPAIVWDIGLPEWGLVVGYDAAESRYHTIDCLGREGELPCDQLGHREIEALSVTVVGKPNVRTREQVVRRALELAVRHGSGGEWAQRPVYQDGPAAYGLWAAALEQGLTHPEGVPSGYYAGHYVGARCYARDFLKALAVEDAALAPAAEAYACVAAELLPVWHAYRERTPERDVARDCATLLRRARAVEEQGLALLAEWLGAN